MKKVLVSIIVILSGIALFAQNAPKPGSLSFGITYNPMAGDISYQPGTGDFASQFVSSMGANPKSMFFLSQEPKASLMMKYHISEKTAFRANLGLNGSRVDYREYVDDMAGLQEDPTSNAVVTDVIHTKLNCVNLGAALEFSRPFKQFQFIAGFGIMYAVGGGSMSFDYGNPLTEEFGWQRITMPMLAVDPDPQKSLNNFPAVNTVGITAGYPVERYNVGYNHGIGFTFDMGLEWFVFDGVSLAASLAVTPVMLVIQPQTWTIYEGYSNLTGKIQQYNDLVSPGSSGCVYGFDNIGLRLSLNYYL